MAEMPAAYFSVKIRYYDTINIGGRKWLIYTGCRKIPFAGKNRTLYVLTGSANIFALPKLADELVGRLSVLTLYPFSASEKNETGVAGTHIRELCRRRNNESGMAA